MENTAYLGLGSNKGKRKTLLKQAVNSIGGNAIVLAKSSIYQTPPWGYESQQPFLNQVIKIKTDLPPQQLLTFCKQIESDIGRIPTFRYGPREIDIDILSYDSINLEEENLKIPHPELQNRAFMLVPLQEIEPDFLHPTLNLTISQMLRDKQINEIVIFSDHSQE